MTDSPWQVLIPEPVDDAGPELLEQFAEVVPQEAHPDEATRRAEIGRFDAIVVRSFTVDQDLLERADQLKVVSKHGAGLDNIDIEAATDHGVVVCNTPNVNAPSVAEHAMALLLAARKRLRVADADVREGVWNRAKYIAPELAGDTLGLFGCGSIGSEVAERAQAFGMEVITYDPYLTPGMTPEGVKLVDSKAALFDHADAVSIHTPLTEETRNAISADELARLDGGIVVNAARGGIIAEDALTDALADGSVAGAGLDVFESEPPASNHPIFTFENVVATPHIAGSTVEALRRMSVSAAENIRMVYEGRLPETTVNAADLEGQLD